MSAAESRPVQAGAKAAAPVPRQPLHGVRVVDLGQLFSIPSAASMLADLGAEVIKVEGPERPDMTRMNGVVADCRFEEDPWNRTSMYNVANRGKKSLVLDLGLDEGRAILRALVARSDIVMENFTPRVMKKWGLDYPALSRAQPGIIMVSNSGYGQGGGPYTDYPAQATTQEATHGLAHLTGYRDGPPSKAGISYIDFLAANACLSGIALALRHKRRTGQGQWIDVGMYQIGCFTTSEYILDWQSNGRLAGRIGNRHPSLAPQGCYPCAGEDQWCVISIASDDQWTALCRVMEDRELGTDRRFATHAGRMEHHDAIDERIAAWSRRLPKADLVRRLQQAGIVAGPVQDAREVQADPHLQARGFFEPVQHAPQRKLGRRALIGRPWTFNRTEAAIRSPAPAFGEHNHEVLQGLLGYSAEDCARFERMGVIASQPRKPIAPAHPAVSMPELVRKGLYRDYDPHYRDAQDMAERPS